MKTFYLSVTSPQRSDYALHDDPFCKRSEHSGRGKDGGFVVGEVRDVDTGLVSISPIASGASCAARRCSCTVF